MKHSLYTPKNPEVCQIINCIGYIELFEDDHLDGWFGMFPNGSSNLTISLNDKEPICCHNSKGLSLLHASCNSPVAIKRAKSLKFINIQFKPYGLYSLKGIPITELQKTSMTLDLLFSPSESEELLDRVYSSHTLLAKFTEVEKFLSHHITQGLLDDRLPFAVSLIKELKAPSIDFLSNAVCLSTRRFRELFSEHTGLSPAFYKKIVRFNKASHQMTENPNTPLTDVALSNFYYDQSHFIKDWS